MTLPGKGREARISESWRRYFARRAEDYPDLYRQPPRDLEARAFQERRRRVERILRRLAGAASGTGQEVLDIGCGSGWLAESLAAGPFSKAGYTGVDAVPEMCSRARDLFPESDTRCFREARAECLPFADDYFDIVCQLGLFEYTASPKHCLYEALRALRSGGYLLVSVSTRYNLENWVKALLWLPRRLLRIVYDYLRKPGRVQVPHLKQYSSAQIRRLLMKTARAGGWSATVLHTEYYNPKPFCFPLSRFWPRSALRISASLEAKANHRPWRWSATGALLLIQKQ